MLLKGALTRDVNRINVNTLEYYSGILLQRVKLISNGIIIFLEVLSSSQLLFSKLLICFQPQLICFNLRITILYSQNISKITLAFYVYMYTSFPEVIEWDNKTPTIVRAPSLNNRSLSLSETATGVFLLDSLEIIYQLMLLKTIRWRTW